MDPDIRFPECEKQYGCGVEYIRADLVADVVAELCRDELIELICKAIGGGEKVGMVDFHVAEAIATALLARPSPDAIISAALERDEALNQLDSARHSVDVLEKRVAKLLKGQTDD
jgi:hypothetical protein